MKLIVRIGADYHLELLPHFLEHYSRIGVDLFLCSLHGERRDEAKTILAQYPCEVVADFGVEPVTDQMTLRWQECFNETRRQHVISGEWCLYADVDEFHEYPPDFFAALDTHVNTVRGWWVERLATSDGELAPCLPHHNIGQQFPFATRKIFCGLSRKVMATRGKLDVAFGYHEIIRGCDQPFYYKDYLKVHHFRWNDRAAAKYSSISWTKHYQFSGARVPELKDVFYVNPPFPPVGPDNDAHCPRVSVILVVQNRATNLDAAIQSIRAQSLNDWELIVVDSGLSDHTNATVASYANGDERIRMLFADGSLAAARRCGFLSARGGYIYCLDANHCSLPDALQRLCDCLGRQLEATAAYGGVDNLKAGIRPLNAFKELGTDGFLNTGAVVIRRSALNAAMADPHCDFEDSSLWWSLLSNGSAAFIEGTALSVSNPLQPTCSIVSSEAGIAEAKPSPYKLAYLIVAHHQPRHLARLIRALNQEYSYFFIHVDAKADLSHFQAVIPRLDNVVFLSDRETVEWGRFSVVQAALSLIRAAISSGHSFRYFTLLSGSDYPVKCRQVISAQLLNSDRQYMRIDRTLTDPGNSHANLLKDLPDGRYFRDMVPYHGSMYWSLNADCMRFILDFIDDNPGYVDIHHSVLIPDEVFFHTLVKHSPFADAITQDFSAGRSPNRTHHGNHFIDWKGLRKRDYLTLDERDLTDLLSSDALFARKFDESKSTKLLDLLDIYVHGCALPVIKPNCHPDG